MKIRKHTLAAALAVGLAGAAAIGAPVNSGTECRPQSQIGYHLTKRATKDQDALRIGGVVGMWAGALAGAKVGAAFGSIGGPVGALVGGVIGSL